MKKDPPPRIVKDPAPLAEEFIPQRFPGRESHLQALLDGLAPTTEGQSLTHLWIHGPPGTGKSSVVRRAVAGLEDRGVRTALVNCWGTQTFFGVLEAIFADLRSLVGDQRDCAFKLERLLRIGREGPLVIVLDEVDQMFLKERKATLYNLSRIEHAGLVCLSQTRDAYLSLDPRIRSRLEPRMRFVDFAPYSEEELASILERRAGKSLAASAWCRADLERIAEHACGDARIAVQTLRTAAYLSEKRRIPQLHLSDITTGLRETSKFRRQYLLRTLSEHHRLIYQIVKAAAQIRAVDAWRQYLQVARQADLEPMKRRTFNHYKQYLVTQRLLRERQGRGRKNARILEVVDDEEEETK